METIRNKPGQDIKFSFKKLIYVVLFQCIMSDFLMFLT